MELFTSFDGRISRQSFWLGILGIIVVSIIAMFALETLFGTSGPISKIVFAVISLALFYLAMAISAKRLHDRNKPTMPWLAIFFLPGIISSLMQTFRINYAVLDMSQMEGIGGMMGMFRSAGQDILVPGKLAMLVSLVSLIVGIWALVELGFLKGTDGENSFGPDPLA